MKNQKFIQALLKLDAVMLVCILMSFSFQQFAHTTSPLNILDCNTSPIITCPSNYFGCPGSDIDPSITGYATAIPGEAGCDDPEVSYEDIILSEGPCTGQMLIKRVWLAEYPNNQNPWLFSECSQILLLEDSSLPTIEDCPADITVDMNISCDNPTWTEPTASDNCMIESLESNYDPGDEFPEGETVVTYTATDGCGNSVECSFTVTVIGACCASSPSLICPSSVYLCPGDSIDPLNTNYAIAVVDPTCGPYSLEYIDVESDDDLCPGHPSIIRIWTISYDEHPELSASCIQEIFFQDLELPMFSFCPTDITIDIAMECESNVSWDEPEANDNCGIESISSNYNSGDLFLAGDTEVIYTAVDSCGNIGTCSFTVTVVNNCCTDPPEIYCPPDYYACPNADINPAIIGYPTIISNNACGPIWISFSDTPNTNNDLCNGYANIIRSWTVKYEDHPDLMASCIQNIYFQDLYAPEFSYCPPDLSFNENEYVTWLSPSATDNCGIESLSSNFSPGDYFPVGTTTVIYTAVDYCGNSAQCSFNVTISGGMLELDCPDDLTIDCGNNVDLYDLYPDYYTTCNVCNEQNNIYGFIYMGSLNGHKYYCSTSPATWETAQLISEQHGGYLASITSEIENDLLSDFLTIQSAYIGLNDVQQEGDFKWVTGEPLSYTNWYPGQPNDYSSGQDYVELLHNGLWNDQYGYKKLEFIMEIPCVSIEQTAGPDLSGTLPSGEYIISFSASDACGNYATCSFNLTVESSLEITCPDDISLSCPFNSNGVVVNWNTPEVSSCCGSNTYSDIPGFIFMGAYNGSNYYCTTQPYTWEEGSAFCAANGGYLASINDAGENAFLANILTIQSAYIGLNDVQQEGQFVWENGDPLSYQNWYPGQPNNFNGIQDHVEMLSNGLWNDQYYYKKLECIMEIPNSTIITQIAGPPSGSVFPKGSTTTISYLASDACGNSASCSFDVNISSNDCSPYGMNSQACWIETVLMENFTNNSGNDNGYGDYTDQCVVMEAGESYWIRIVPSCNYAMYWSLYLDYNMDGDFFDNMEFIGYGNAAGGITGIITLPQNIWNGDATLRIMMHNGSYASSPCDSQGYGEIEDYCISIIGATNINNQENVNSRASDNEPTEFLADHPELKIYPNPAYESICIDQFNKKEIEYINIINAAGKLMKSFDKPTSIQNCLDIMDLNAGSYILQCKYLHDLDPKLQRFVIAK